MAEMLKRDDLLELGDRMVRLRYSIDANHLDLVFQHISIGDYMILTRFRKQLEFDDPKRQVYLSEISKEMDIPIQKVSHMVQNLQGKGYVYWEHDEKGTYIYISEIGRDVMQKQQQILQKYFGNVVERMGYDNFTQVLELMMQVELIMQSEAEKFVENIA